MEKETSFQYTYSAPEQQEVLKIREKYLAAPANALDELKALDRKVRQPADTFCYVFGSVSAIIMGAGMSLVMTDIGTILGLSSTMVPGIAIGVVGLALALTTYPIYKAMLRHRQKKYGPEIIKLSDSILSAKHSDENN